MSWLSRGSQGLGNLLKKAGGRPPFEGAYIYVLCLTLGYMIADLSVLYVRPAMLPSQAPPGKPKKIKTKKFPSRGDYEYILTRNIFNSDGKIPPPKVAEGSDETQPADGPARLSQLPLTLQGTIVHADGSRSLATINVKSKNEIKTLAIEQEIEGMILVKKIERRKVTFRNLNNNLMEFIEIPREEKIAFGMKSPQASGGNIQKRGEFDFVLNRKEINKYTADLPTVLQQARMVPNIVPGSGGKIDGFRFVTIQPNSIYEKLGFKPMDIIKTVNGEGVNSPTRAMELYNALKSENRIGLTIERNGREENFSYDINE